jgi:beta-galactosidase
LLNSGELDIPETPPGTTSTIAIPKSVLESVNTAEIWLTVSFRLRNSTSWAAAGHEISWFQHNLTASQPSKTLQTLVQKVTLPLQLQSTKTEWIISNTIFKMTFDRVRGSLKSWQASGNDLLETDPLTTSALSLSFWRSPTDNDRPGDEIIWRRYGVDALTSQLRSFVIKQSDSTQIVLQSTAYLSPPILAWGFTSTTTYTISHSGSLTVTVHLIPQGSHPEFLPRLGFNVRLHSGSVSDLESRIPTKELRSE